MVEYQENVDVVSMREYWSVLSHY